MSEYTERLEQIKKRCEEATDRKWHASQYMDDGKWGVTDNAGRIIVSTRSTGLTEADAQFIASAREDVPWLLKEVDTTLKEHYHLCCEIERLEHELKQAKSE